MLYELVGISRVPVTMKKEILEETRQILTTIGKSIIDNRGVIREIDNWGIKPLPKIMKKDRQQFAIGAYFYMKFDASPAVQTEIARTLRMDPRMIRSTIVRVGGST